jgi:hypothetical protein
MKVCLGFIYNGLFGLNLKRFVWSLFMKICLGFIYKGLIGLYLQRFGHLKSNSTNPSTSAAPGPAAARASGS